MAPLYTIDSLMNQGQLKFSEACKCYRLIREGWTAEEATAIINNRKIKKEQKKQMKKKKNTQSLEQLIKGLDTRALNAENLLWKQWELFKVEQSFQLYQELAMSEDPAWAADNDALNHINHKESMELNDPKISKDALDLCYSNTDGAEVLF